MVASIASSATDLVAYVNKLLSQSLDLTQEIKKGDAGAVVAAVLPRVGALLAHEASADVEGAFTLLLDVLRQLPVDQATAQGQKLLAEITSVQDAQALTRLRIATNLFNKATALPELRFDALVAIIKYAHASDNLDLVSCYFEGIEGLCPELTVEKRRALFLTIADVLPSKDATSMKSLLVLEKYLNTFAAVTDEKTLATGKNAAVRATRLVLQHPITSVLAGVDLLANPVVATLKACKTNAKLFQLLEILSAKSLVEYTAFQKSAGSAFFNENQVNEDECLDAMRLFTLCSFATGFDEIPYAAVAKALAVKEDEVEQWVVKAITANLVNAKIDQLKQTVVISSAVQRGFNVQQWKEVGHKLQVYKKNVGALLELVRNARRAQQQQ